MKIKSLILVGFLLLLVTSADAAEFKVLKDTDEAFVVMMSRRIEPHDAKKFDDLFRYNKAIKKILVLNSKGGDYTASTVIGYGVRQYGVTTYIPKRAICFSGCSLIFVAGWDKEKGRPSRIKHKTSRLGVHRPGVPEQFADDFMVSRMIPYLADMKAGERFIQITNKTPFRKLYFIKNSELNAMGDYQILNY